MFYKFFEIIGILPLAHTGSICIGQGCSHSAGTVACAMQDNTVPSKVTKSFIFIIWTQKYVLKLEDLTSLRC